MAPPEELESVGHGNRPSSPHPLALELDEEGGLASPDKLELGLAPSDELEGHGKRPSRPHPPASELDELVGLRSAELELEEGAGPGPALLGAPELDPVEEGQGERPSSPQPPALELELDAGSAEFDILELESVEEGHGKRPSKPQPPAEEEDDGVCVWSELFVVVAAAVELDSEEEDGQGIRPKGPHSSACDEGEPEDEGDEELDELILGEEPEFDEELNNPGTKGFNIPPSAPSSPPISIWHKFNQALYDRRYNYDSPSTSPIGPRFLLFKESERLAWDCNPEERAFAGRVAKAMMQRKKTYVDEYI